MKDIRRLVIQLILLIVALFVLYLLVVFASALHTQSPLRSFKAAPPPNTRPSAESAAVARTTHIRPSAESAAIAKAPQSFQYLVSVTDRGFEPSTLNIKKGETVRFTNNSSATRHLTVDSDIFASTGTIVPADLRELTFNQRGAFQYSDVASGKTGTINVK